MSRLPLVSPDQTDAPSHPLLAQIRQATGGVTNLFRAAAHSPAALKGLWGLFASLSGGALPSSVREQIALTVADRNQCGYCVSAHTFLGRRAGLSAEDMALAQVGDATDAKARAALRFAARLVDSHGSVVDADVQALRDAGFDDGEIVEVLANVALGIFSNYLSTAFAVPSDFPPVPLRRPPAG